jgi:hypothetical protein
MVCMRAGRALLRAVRHRRPDSDVDVPPVFWGRIGEYEAVSGRGMLFLLAPDPGHPSRRVIESPATPEKRMVS